MGFSFLLQYAIQVIQKWFHRPAGHNHLFRKIAGQDLQVREVMQNGHLLELQQIDIRMGAVVAFRSGFEALPFDLSELLDKGRIACDGLKFPGSAGRSPGGNGPTARVWACAARRR